MIRMLSTGIRPRKNSLQPQDSHQPRHPLGIDRKALLTQPGGHSAVAVKRRLGVLFIDFSLQQQVQFIRRLWLVIVAGSVDVRQRALPGD